jgi:hypothetical protein
VAGEIDPVRVVDDASEHGLMSPWAAAAAQFSYVGRYISKSAVSVFISLLQSGHCKNGVSGIAQ